jgi:hypothetical protein
MVHGQCLRVFFYIASLSLDFYNFNNVVQPTNLFCLAFCQVLPTFFFG